jgi:hypothetical protein
MGLYGQIKRVDDGSKIDFFLSKSFFTKSMQCHFLMAWHVIFIPLDILEFARSNTTK